MAMSKKDFIALADAIRDHNRLVASYQTPDVSAFEPNQLETLASFARSQNPRFMRERWLGYIRGECGSNGGAIRTRKVGA